MASIAGPANPTGEATAACAAPTQIRSRPARRGVMRHYFSNYYSPVYQDGKWSVRELQEGMSGLIPPPISGDVMALDAIRGKINEEYVLTEADTRKKEELEKKLNLQKIVAVTAAVVAPQLKVEAPKPRFEACYAAPHVAVVSHKRVRQEERSTYFVIESIASGNLPIGAWSVRKTAVGEQGSDWTALPYPADLKKDIKRLEELMAKNELSESEQKEKIELEAKYKL